LGNMSLPLVSQKEMPFIRSLNGIHDAAVKFRDQARAVGDFQVAACANVASKDPMVDNEGNPFGAIRMVSTRAYLMCF